LDEYQAAHEDDLLLTLERAGNLDALKSQPGDAQHVKAGLAATVGWLLYRWAAGPQPEGFEAAPGWFERNLSANAHNADWDDPAAFYSSFLQWIVKRSPETLARISAPDFGGDLAPRLRFILEDELVWAILEKRFASAAREAWQDLRTALEVDSPS